MKVAVVGLGLIGGSLCRALKAHTSHTVLGVEQNARSAQQALECGAVDQMILPEQLIQADITFVCLHPYQTIEFILQHQQRFAKGSIVCDVCGVKQAVVNRVEGPLMERGVHYVGAHPMAGSENWGFGASVDGLFDGASFILTKTEATSPAAMEAVGELARLIGFGRVVECSPQQHDQTIAFTSQLAHVVSSAYIKSPTVNNQSGFSAGSFQDLTRVAKLNEDMWSALFLLNRDALLAEIDIIMEHLAQYRKAIAEEDGPGLTKLLKDGRLAKENTLKK